MFQKDVDFSEIFTLVIYITQKIAGSRTSLNLFKSHILTLQQKPLTQETVSEKKPVASQNEYLKALITKICDCSTLMKTESGFPQLFKVAQKLESSDPKLKLRKIRVGPESFEMKDEV